MNGSKRVYVAAGCYIAPIALGLPGLLARVTIGYATFVNAGLMA